ncbi:MAG: lysine--tRNA ligase [Nitrospirae bacterium]|nr:MAG: lysine--tRNA ligase [Nitrospirota bacterium]
MARDNDQVRARREKVAALRAAGIEPYARDGAPSHRAAEVAAAYGDRDAEALEREPVAVGLAGRLMALRRFGKTTFAHLQDESGRLQLFFNREVLGEAYGLVKRLDLGDIVAAAGPLFRTRTGELTVRVERLTLLTKALRPLPEKWHGLTDVETRFRQRYLDLIANPEVREIFRTRSRIVDGLRRFLLERGFLEVETPMMHPIAGGAAARPFVTHHNALDRDLYLRIAPELYLKRLVVGGFERVFEINRNFRNEGLDLDHNPEFTMVEFYQAYATYEDLMGMVEELVVRLAEDHAGGLALTWHGQAIDLTPPWPRLPLLQAVRERVEDGERIVEDPAFARERARELGLEPAAADPHGKVVVKIFEEVVEPTLVNPTFVVDYPVAVSPLARRKPDAPELVERFELFIGAREIANAFTELNDPDDQRARFEEQMAERAAGDEEAHPLDEDYLTALEHGMPPTAGCGIGIDRLVMLLTGTDSIREVILFPQMRPKAG